MKWTLGIAALCVFGSVAGFYSGYSRESEALDTHLAAIVDPRAQREAILTLKRERASLEREHALEKALASGNFNAFSKLIRKSPWLSASQMEMTLKMLENIDDAERWYSELLKQWAKVDSATALRFAISDLQGSTQYQGLCGVFETLANKDPGHAFATWKETRNQLDDLLSAQGALLSITDSWWIRDLPAAMSAIQTIEGESDRRSAINGCFSRSFDEASDDDKARLLAVFKSFEDTGNRNHGVKAFANALARNHSLSEMEIWMQEQSLTGDALAHAERGAAEQHLGKNPKEAAQWLGKRATEESLAEHLNSIVIRWAMHEPNAVGEWLGTFPLSEKTDTATIAFANTISHDDIESAFHWAQRVQDSEKRFDSLKRFAKHWVKDDLDAAVEAITQADLTETQTAALLDDLIP